MSIVRAILPRHVKSGAASYELRPPTTREALILLSAARDALMGDDDAYSLVLYVLKDWYPSTMFIETRRADPREVVSYALQIMQQGTQQRKASDEIAEEGREADWDSILSLYMHTYGVSLSEALEEPWAGFLLMASHIGRIESRNKLNYLHAKGLPHIRDKNERARAMSRLQRAAGIDTVRPKKVSKEEAEANLKELEQQFALFGGLGRAKA